MPEVAVYNAAILIAFTLTTYGMFRLARELTGDVPSAFFAGLLFSATPYHLAHLQGHLHLLSMGWLPLALLYVLRMTHGSAHGTRRDAVLAGVFLAVASLASWYHLVFAAVILPVLVIHGVVRDRRGVLSFGVGAKMLAAATTFLVLAGPLLAAMASARSREAFSGAHDPTTFSADLQAFVLPNAAQGWRDAFGAHYLRWTGNSTENAVYVGVTMIVLASIGAFRHGLARAFLVVALLGAILALGPLAHVDGKILPVTMPYGHLERAVPALAFAGVPVRFGYVMYLGLVVAAAFGFAETRRAFATRPAVAAVLALALATVALAEYRPRPLITWDYPIPAPMRAWARDPGSWAVLDVWDYYRPMWHAAIHRKPLVGGYLTRVPQRLDDWLHREPVVRSLFFPNDEWELSRHVPDITFDESGGGGDPPVGPGPFRVEWRGTIFAARAGEYELAVSSARTAELAVDGVVLARRGVRCRRGSACGDGGAIALARGPHDFRLVADLLPGDPVPRLEWRPPGAERERVPAAAWHTADGRPGLSAVYRQQIPATCAENVEAGRHALRALDVRYVVTRDASSCAEHDLGLPLAYLGEGVRIYEVPAP
jgi:hypothetical protein